LHEAWSLVTGEARAREEVFRSESQTRALHSLIASGQSDPLSRFVTEDGSRVRIEVRLRDEGASRILALLSRFEQKARALGTRNVTFSGEAWDASHGLSRIMDSLGGLASAIVMIFVVMTLLFRSLRLGLLSIPPNALPLVMTLAYMAFRDIPLHAGTIIAFTVTVGLAVDGATHVIARFREESERGGSVEETLARTMMMSGRGVVLSTATLLVGYGALLRSAFEPVRLFGELSAVAMAFALIAQLVLLPALLAAFAKRDQRPIRPSKVI
jgi:predicted RND superfamily exporter protein